MVSTGACAPCETAGAISDVGCAAGTLAVIADTPMPSDRHAAKKDDASLFIVISSKLYELYLQRPWRDFAPAMWRVGGWENSLFLCCSNRLVKARGAA